MPWTINSEIYPLWARSTGNACAAGVNWTFNILVSVTFLHLAQYLTYYGQFEAPCFSPASSVADAQLQVFPSNQQELTFGETRKSITVVTVEGFCSAASYLSIQVIIPFVWLMVILQSVWHVKAGKALTWRWNLKWGSLVNQKLCFDGRKIWITAVRKCHWHDFYKSARYLVCMDSIRCLVLFPLAVWRQFLSFFPAQTSRLAWAMAVGSAVTVLSSLLSYRIFASWHPITDRVFPLCSFCSCQEFSSCTPAWLCWVSSSSTAACPKPKLAAWRRSRLCLRISFAPAVLPIQTRDGRWSTSASRAQTTIYRTTTPQTWIREGSLWSRSECVSCVSFSGRWNKQSVAFMSDPGFPHRQAKILFSTSLWSNQKCLVFHCMYQRWPTPYQAIDFTWSRHYTVEVEH